MTPALVSALDLAAVFVFAVSGALLAARSGMDAFGLFVVGLATGVGGGTLRDLLLDRPVFWLADGRYLLTALAAAALVGAAGPRLEALNRPLSWADAAGLAIAAPLGVAAARGMEAHWTAQIVMGVMTGCVGGMIRDLLCQVPPMVLHREVYALAALAGAAAGVGAFALGAGPVLSAAACALLTFALRAAAVARGWEAPRWRGLGR